MGSGPLEEIIYDMESGEFNSNPCNEIKLSVKKEKIEIDKTYLKLSGDSNGEGQDNSDSSSSGEGVKELLQQMAAFGITSVKPNTEKHDEKSKESFEDDRDGNTDLSAGGSKRINVKNKFRF